MSALYFNSDKISEKINDGQHSAREVLRLVGQEIDRLNGDKTAIETMKETLMAGLSQHFGTGFKCGRCGHDKKFWSVKNDDWYCDQCKYIVR